MDAKKVGDVVDYWNLRATGKQPILPVPIQLKESPEMKEIIDRFLKGQQQGENSRHGKQIPGPVAGIFRARSCACSIEEMQEYAGVFDGGSLELKNAAYPKIWSTRSDGVVPCDIYGDTRSFTNPVNTQEDQIRIRQVLPKLGYSDRNRPVCANEISIRSHWGSELVAEAFPRFCGENFIRAVSGPDPCPEDWRVGKNGLVRLVKNSFDEPREVPLSERVFFAWLRDFSWKKIELSSAGLLSKRIYERLGGYVSRLQNERLLWLLEHMNGGSVNLNKGPIGRDKINQEREISVAQVKSRLEKEEPARKSLYDYAVENGFFRLGAHVKCPNCFRHSWYSLENIGDLFNCPKCLEAFPAIGNLDSGGNNPWYYKTAGPFSIPNYADGAYAVLLTLDFFNTLKLKSLDFHITPVMSFYG